MGVTEVFEAAMETLLRTETLRDVEVVMTAARRQGATTELRVMIDRPGGVDLALCEAFAKGINGALRDTPDLYTLEVESAGLERPLVREADYLRFAGRPVCVKTHKLWEGAKTHRGKLEGLRDGAAVLSGPQGDVAIPLNLIKQAHLEFDLREALKRGSAAPAPPERHRKKHRT